MMLNQYISELRESSLVTCTNRCALCHAPLSREYSPRVELIGPICRECEEKMKTRSVYTCLFCRSAGFMEEETPDHQVPEVMVTISCPFCHEPVNELPI